MALGLLQTSGQRAGDVDGVGVGEEEPFATSLGGAGGDGVVLAGPAFEQGVGFDDMDPGNERAIARVWSVEWSSTTMISKGTPV